MDKSTVIWLTAFSGLAGALLTQLLTGLFAYANDRRKQKTELESLYRAKKLEIGENFYFINGELMTMMRKNIDYWRNLRNDRSEQTLQLMKKEMEKLDVYQSQLLSDNWKYNLISVYFEVPFSFDEIQQGNRESHRLYLRVIDLSNKIRATVEKDELYKSYSIAVFDLCTHYGNIYARMEENMTAVRAQLLLEFGQPTFRQMLAL